jgi:rhodanese-related sulfurtransferase
MLSRSRCGFQSPARGWVAECCDHEGLQDLLLDTGSDEQKPEGFLSAFKENSHLEIVGICKEIDSPPSSPSDGPLLPIIHFESLKHALETLDRKEEVIVYCSNFGCTASVLMYQRLIEHGFQNLKRYAGGIADWEDAGYPLEGEHVNRTQSEA